VRLLRDNGVSPTIVDLNHDVVRTLTAAGTPAMYGDASQREILERAGIAHAASLVIAAGDAPVEAIVKAAKELNPHITVLARAPYLQSAEAVRHAGADVVVAAEGEVALAMTERLLRQLGATEEQLDRERHRVRDELLGAPVSATV
jgi:CPA2 family monovalent cation:H+ antiporter-2